jgi:hypothetical protein
LGELRDHTPASFTLLHLLATRVLVSGAGVCPGAPALTVVPPVHTHLLLVTPCRTGCVLKRPSCIQHHPVDRHPSSRVVAHPGPPRAATLPIGVGGGAGKRGVRRVTTCCNGGWRCACRHSLTSPAGAAVPPSIGFGRRPVSVPTSLQRCTLHTPHLAAAGVNRPHTPLRNAFRPPACLLACKPSSLPAYRHRTDD